MHVNDLHIPKFVKCIKHVFFYLVVHLITSPWNIFLVSSRSRLYVSYIESISSSESVCSLFGRRYICNCAEYRGSAFKRRSSNSDDTWPINDKQYEHASFAKYLDGHTLSLYFSAGGKDVSTAICRAIFVALSKRSSKRSSHTAGSSLRIQRLS